MKRSLAFIAGMFGLLGLIAAGALYSIGIKRFLLSEWQSTMFDIGLLL